MQKPNRILLRFNSERMKIHSSTKQEVLIVTALAIVLVFIYLPKISLFLSTPMLPINHELQDPTVSFLDFDPGYRVFQYELFNNKNIWWSNLRGMGLPLLGNEIQAAPLFPLVLLLSWLPFEYFWNAFVVLKVILLGAGTLLICRHLIHFKWLTAVFFTILFVYNLHVIRWINHPWHTGLLAGTWYIYFVGLSVGFSIYKFGPKWFLVTLGIALTAYAMLTCGFPESSVAMALLMVLVLVPYLVWMACKKKIAYVRWGVGITVGHFIGFAMASPQMLSLLEFLSLRETSIRGGFGIRQYKWPDLLPFVSERIIPTSEKISFVYKDNGIYLGIIPLFFFILGVLYFLIKRKETTPWVLSASFCFLFISFKLYPVAPFFNEIIGSMPILRECHFFVYFFILFIFFYSYFSAVGFEKYILRPFNKKSGYLSIIISCILVLCILNATTVYVKDKNLLAFAINDSGKLMTWLSIFLIVIFGALTQHHISKKQNGSILACAISLLIIFGLIYETKTMLNLRFPERKAFNSALKPKTAQLVHILKQRAIPVHEARIIDQYGKYCSGGIATIDNGAPPIIPERVVRFRRALFKTKYGGYLPIQKPKFDYSWDVTSVNLIHDNIFYGSNESIIDGSTSKENLEESLPWRCLPLTRYLKKNILIYLMVIKMNIFVYQVGQLITLKRVPLRQGSLSYLRKTEKR